jgi:uracil-DNA glycosylase
LQDLHHLYTQVFPRSIMQFFLKNTSWQVQLQNEFNTTYWSVLKTWLSQQYAQKTCFPEQKNIFRAFDSTSFEQTRVIILGQDPYHTPGAAMGLSFSVPQGYKLPPSLRNIFAELRSDL